MLGAPGDTFETTHRKLREQQNAQNAYLNMMGGPVDCGPAMNSIRQETTDMATDNEAIPDVSLVRVAKWAIVLFLAMALGEKFWSTFGPRITSNLHKAIGGANPPQP